MKKAQAAMAAEDDVVQLVRVKRDGTIPQTMASTLFDAIRSDIMRGHLAPGSKLKIHELGARYGAGTIPVREALSRLATSGFVDAKDQRGFSVRPVSAAELLDLHRVRLLLESMAVRDAIEHGDLTWESHVLAAHHRLAGLGPFVTSRGHTLNVDWESAHDEFHRSIVAACTSPWLLQFLETARNQMARYRHISARAPQTITRDVEGEHRGIVEAVLARNADLAVERLTAHFVRSTTLAMTVGLVGQDAPTLRPPAVLPGLGALGGLEPGSAVAAGGAMGSPQVTAGKAVRRRQRK